ncbi:MAG: hypothetical protein FJ290_26550, partial [Planctomycetes bacterium]|nr:hypothetical protein [Planctomycetota bacterium]
MRACRRCTDRDGVRLEWEFSVLKAADNPPSLPPGIEAPASLDGRWWVAHTKARNEKALAWELLRHGIGYFLPMCQHVFFSGGRKRRALIPLFTSYVFFCGDEVARRAVLATNRVCRALEVADQQRLVRELSAIQQALSASADLEPYPHAAVGQRCRIKAGPFVGLEGVVVDRRTHAQLVLEVSLVGRYLDRDRATLATMSQIHRLALRMAEAMGRRDLPAFGEL